MFLAGQKKHSGKSSGTPSPGPEESMKPWFILLIHTCRLVELGKAEWADTMANIVTRPFLLKDPFWTRQTGLISRSGIPLTEKKCGL
jgi:hypothetical protein